MTTDQTLVGMAEMQVIKGSGTLVCIGLGSCVGVCIVDPTANVAGMIHVMLPESFPNTPVEKPGKFANTGIPTMISLLEAQGASKNRMIVAYVGGAQVFKFGNSGESKLDIGLRNAQAVEAWIGKAGLKVLKTDVGGTVGRTVTYSTDSGDLKVKTVQKGEAVLCNLKK